MNFTSTDFGTSNMDVSFFFFFVYIFEQYYGFIILKLLLYISKFYLF